jgi:Concanavalin A-like lectin/glucanases superfamily
MSTSLIILLPVVLLGMVGMLCFVGCVLQTGGLGNGNGNETPFTAYSGTTILPTSTIIAYWPLKEGKDSDPAHELVSGNDGKYIDQTTVMPPNTVYPWISYNVPKGGGLFALSAAAPGDIMLGQPSIVAGDVDLLPGDPVAPACMVVNGCYVEVPWNDKFIPKVSFTVEAWVRVDWTATDPSAWRFVLDMREQTPVTTGFGILAQAIDDAPGMYRWAAIIGDGSSSFQLLENTEAPITLKDPAAAAGTIVYLTLTYNAGSKTLTLFVNGASVGQLTQVGYMPNAAQVLWIGAATAYEPRRTQPADPNVVASPLFPFVGAIQDVAIYSDVLADSVIVTHFNNGSGNQ